MLADTEESDANLDAVRLHGELAALGFELRTLALAPGRTGGLAPVVPVMAPSRRSFAALSQLRAESRWADVVVVQGSAALPPGVGFLPPSAPLLLALRDGDASTRAARRLERAGRLRAWSPSGPATSWAGAIAGAVGERRPR